MCRIRTAAPQHAPRLLRAILPARHHSKLHLIAAHPARAPSRHCAAHVRPAACATARPQPPSRRRAHRPARDRARSCPHRSQDTTHAHPGCGDVPRCVIAFMSAKRRAPARRCQPDARTATPRPRSHDEQGRVRPAASAVRRPPSQSPAYLCMPPPPSIQDPPRSISTDPLYRRCGRPTCHTCATYYRVSQALATGQARGSTTTFPFLNSANSQLALFASAACPHTSYLLSSPAFPRLSPCAHARYIPYASAAVLPFRAQR